MPMPKGYVKAKLAIEGGETIDALFNPTEFSITKGNDWSFDPIKGTSLPKGKFGGGKPREMQVTLMLDRSQRLRQSQPVARHRRVERCPQSPAPAAPHAAQPPAARLMTAAEHVASA